MGGRLGGQPEQQGKDKVGKQGQGAAGKRTPDQRLGQSPAAASRVAHDKPSCRERAFPGWGNRYAARLQKKADVGGIVLSFTDSVPVECRMVLWGIRENTEGCRQGCSGAHLHAAGDLDSGALVLFIESGGARGSRVRLGL